MQCKLYRGTISILGQWVDEIGEQWSSTVPSVARSNRSERDGTGRYHFTVVAPNEFDTIDINELDTTEINAEVVGLSMIQKGSLQSWYAVVYCPWADSLRSKLGLPRKELHITLGFIGGDLYGESSLCNSILQWNNNRKQLYNLVALIISTPTKLQQGKRDYSREIIILSGILDKLQPEGMLLSEQIKMFKSVALWCMQCSTFETVNVAQDIGHILLQKGIPYGLFLLLQCNKDVHNAIDLEYNLPQAISETITDNVKNKIIRDCNILLFDRKKKIGSIHKKYSIERVFSMYKGKLDRQALQRNFSWASLEGNSNNLCCSSDTVRYLPYLLAGSAIPTHKSQLSAMYGVGIRHILTVHENPLPGSLCPTIPVSQSISFDQFNVQQSAQFSDTTGIVSYHFPVIDRYPPSSAQLLQMCYLIHTAVSKLEGVLVHCQGGVGRTNTVIIAYLMWSQGLSAAEATAQVTAQRMIILSQAQKNTLQRWWKECNEYRNNTPTVPVVEETTIVTAASSIPLSQSTTPTPTATATPAAEYRKVASTLQLPPVILLCGYAASGKSTFSKALEAHSEYFYRINKDEMRGKNQCEDALFDALTAMKKNRSGGNKSVKVKTIPGQPSSQVGTIVVDCCNLSIAKRKEWLQLAHNPRAWCIYFALSLEECKERISQRVGHPTILNGAAGVKILDSMSKVMQPPCVETATKEGFERLIIVHSGEEATALLRSWRITVDSTLSTTWDLGNEKLPVRKSNQDNKKKEVEVEQKEESQEEEVQKAEEGIEEGDKLLKFPRTAHILNLGAATRDDKLLGPTDLAALIGPTHHIIVEEKLDGANMGISISKSENRIIVQNRSHFISSKYHPQFSPLDHWIATHTADLWSILTPGRHILYGEWLYATHSVKYTHLPAWFVAYDLYDRVTKQFASRSVLSTLLAQTSIPHVPLIFEGSLSTIDELKAMVHGTSKYNTHQREGIVVRLCKDNELISRAKLVRADFIAGNERWNRSSKLEVNSLAPNNH